MIYKKTAKDILGESIIDLSRTKTLDKITVKEITENCGYSIPTFYRHFKDKDELICWVFIHQLEEELKKLFEEKKDWHTVLMTLVNVCGSNKSYYRNAYKNTEGPNSFYYCMVRFFTEKAMEVLNFEDEKEKKKKIFMIHLYIQGVARAIMDWLFDAPHASLTAEELVECLYDIRPHTLNELFK